MVKLCRDAIEAPGIGKASRGKRQGKIVDVVANKAYLMPLWLLLPGIDMPI